MGNKWSSSNWMTKPARRLFPLCCNGRGHTCFGLQSRLELQVFHQRTRASFIAINLAMGGGWGEAVNKPQVKFLLGVRCKCHPSCGRTETDARQEKEWNGVMKTSSRVEEVQLKGLEGAAGANWACFIPARRTTPRFASPQPAPKEFPPHQFKIHLLRIR